jgi:hypothetical protein
MSIQRTGYEIRSAMHGHEKRGVIILEVSFDGSYEDRYDAFLMIACAWSDAMKEAGLDPVKSILTMDQEGKLH